VFNFGNVSTSAIRLQMKTVRLGFRLDFAGAPRFFYTMNKGSAITLNFASSSYLFQQGVSRIANFLPERHSRNENAIAWLCLSGMMGAVNLVQASQRGIALGTL
jgi:hypothetical protein